jgi:acyl-coenzyme A synthetase/AMP-(fatty) acid ligase
VLRAGMSVSAEAIALHCRDQIAAFKVPKSMRFLRSLPKNTSGKILKRELANLK